VARLHDAVQAATPASIALLALEPDARKKSSVRITAEAKSSDDMIAYVERLQQEDWFSAWRWCATKSTSRIRTGRSASSSTPNGGPP
jgi:hypothetical protein